MSMLTILCQLHILAATHRLVYVSRVTDVDFLLSFFYSYIFFMAGSFSHHADGFLMHPVLARSCRSCRLLLTSCIRTIPIRIPFCPLMLSMHPIYDAKSSRAAYSLRE
ncbi:hypothetical protein FIBSPDRAFT_289508 [Athelia psychrophila]|uniref:Uncharacterized protein n=1 Tax=Athelia psychrophila TaxID=1759441 RepID=A0A167XJG7_9AGAM|nr:hypothetical protein FIBSPDRAFT_289508 [Fibularhizoctonia sp. CBS 109695]